MLERRWQAPLRTPLIAVAGHRGPETRSKRYFGREACVLRAPVSEWQRTTAQSLVGATFQDGARFGSGFAVPEIRAMASAGRKLA